MSSNLGEQGVTFLASYLFRPIRSLDWMRGSVSVQIGEHKLGQQLLNVKNGL